MRRSLAILIVAGTLGSPGFAQGRTHEGELAIVAEYEKKKLKAKQEAESQGMLVLFWWCRWIRSS
jgi:hypothetical protein